MMLSGIQPLAMHAAGCLLQYTPIQLLQVSKVWWGGRAWNIIGAERSTSFYCTSLLTEITLE